MVNRREFISAVGAVSLASTATSANTALIKPPRIRPGDLVGLASPATAAFETEQTKIWVDALESLGIDVEIDADAGTINMLETGVSQEANVLPCY
jgi:muramoyltetrapeptide carboxypeptidase